MWRFWNCVPRFVRQQLHGPRASAGVCVEEEKGDHEAEKLILDDGAQEQHGTKDRDAQIHGCRWRHHRSHYGSRFWAPRKQSVPETDAEKETHHFQSQEWNCPKGDDHHPSFWPPWWHHGDAEKPVLNEDVQEQQHHGTAADEGPQVLGPRHHRHHCRFKRLRTQDVQEADDPTVDISHAEGATDGQKRTEQGRFWSGVLGQEGGTSDYGHRQWWKQRCRGQHWSQMWGQQHSLEAVTWGAAMVFGLQLSRKPQFQDFLEMWKDPNKRAQWWSLLLRVAFSKPPDGARQSIVQGLLPQKPEADAKAGENTQKPLQAVPETVVPDSDDKKTLSDVMQEFQASCQQYAAVTSSVSGLLAAEQGKTMAAVEHLKQASLLGHAPAYFNLALCYDMGLGVKKDQKQAALYYQQAAELGHAQSAFNLALMTLRGDGGLAKDRTRALQLLNQAAKQGLAQAQTYLGVYYTENDDHQQNLEEAASFFRAAASQNDAEGQYFLGICYENGWGVESSDEEAARLYSAAAELGHDGALYNLAAFHEYGLGGVERNEDEAMALYRHAAQHGNESAKLRLDEYEARKAVSLWAEQTSEIAAELSPKLHQSPQRSSSPVFSDFLRDSMAGLWSGELSAWFSSQSLNSSSRLGHRQRAASVLDDSGDSGSSVSSADLDFPQRGSMVAGQGCFAGLHRTSTMPDLRMVSCQ